MRLTVKEEYGESFAKLFLPSELRSLCMSKLSKRLKSRGLMKMLDYLKSSYDIDAIEFISALDDYMLVTKHNGFYIVEFDKNMHFGKLSADALASLIDDGNLSCRGMQIIGESFKLIQRNINIIHKGYKIRGGM